MCQVLSEDSDVKILDGNEKGFLHASGGLFMLMPRSFNNRRVIVQDIVMVCMWCFDTNFDL